MFSELIMILISLSFDICFLEIEFYRAMSTGGEVLRLRGLPWTAGAAEVAQFLHECFGDSQIQDKSTQYTTSIFEDQPHQNRIFPIKTRVIWIPGISRYVFMNI